MHRRSLGRDTAALESDEDKTAAIIERMRNYLEAEFTMQQITDREARDIAAAAVRVHVERQKFRERCNAGGTLEIRKMRRQLSASEEKLDVMIEQAIQSTQT